jgi:branched-chain amino acid aminotransferase
MAGAQDIAEDPRNAGIRVYLNGRMVPREQAVVSVFDAGYIAGDGVWEGMRLHHGRLVFLEEHLDRLFYGARAIDLEIGLSRDALAASLYETCRVNGMEDGVHLRLMVTRGPKRTPSQDPRSSIGPATIVIVAEWKMPPASIYQDGLALLTSTIRCTRPDQFDMRLNSHSRLNLITALIQAYKAGADEALMLDDAGFVSSGNSTNFFFVRGREVFTSTGRNCFRGITRGKVIALCRANDIPVHEDNFTLMDVYNAEEAFVTGSFGGLTPVRMIDGRAIKPAGPVTCRLSALYQALIAGIEDFS